MATAKSLLRARLHTALQDLSTGHLRTSATALLATLGYASHKTLDLPTAPRAFAHEVENLLGNSKPWPQKFSTSATPSTASCSSCKRWRWPD